MELLIRRSGTLIDVSPDGQSPLSPALVDLLAPQLCYQHRELLRGAAAYDDVTGRHSSMRIEPRNMYRIEQGRLVTGFGFLPRISQLLQQHGHQVDYVDVSPPRRRPRCYETDWPTVLNNFTFRERQIERLQAIANSPGGIINATMGFGKTHCLKVLPFLYPHAKFAIVVKGVDLVEATVRRLTAALPNVGMVHSTCKRYGRVTVYSAGCVDHCDGDVDFLLADEAPRLMPREYSEALARVFLQTRNFGFSGTPYARMDGAHAMLEMFFGPEIFRLTYPEAVALGLVTPIRVRWVPMRLQHNPAAGKMGVTRTRWGIWRNEERNAGIANDIHTHYVNNEQVLVAVETIEHAIHLWRHMPEFILCYGKIDADELTGYKRSGLLPNGFQAITPEQRYNYQAAFADGRIRKAIATDVWSTGQDFPGLQVLWRADARESEELCGQWPTRTSRLFEGKPYAELVDAVDTFDKTLRNKSSTRRRHYAAYEWEQQWPSGRRQIEND